MLMMAPLFCRRMIGITCLAAKMQLLRLIATQRSSACSVKVSSSESPPARLTPTLLCRMSMRPQRVCASSTMALISACLVTSAFKADVTKQAEIKAMVDDAHTRWGRIDILHNNVGVSLAGGDSELDTFTEQALDRCVAINLKSCI